MKKYILFFLSLFVLVLSNINLCYADEFVVQLPDLPVREDYPYYIIYKYSDSRYILNLIPSIDYTVSTGWDLNGHKHFYFGPLNYLSFIFNVDSTEWVVNGSSTGVIFIGGDGGSCSDCNVVYSNFEMCYNGSVVLNKHEFSTGGFDEPVEKPSILDGIGSFFDSLFEKLGNWFNSLINFVKDIPQLIIDGFKDLFVLLFVPCNNLFDDFKTLIEDKFGIFSQLSNIVFDSTTIELNDAAPNFHITISGKDYTFIDLSCFMSS